MKTPTLGKVKDDRVDAQRLSCKQLELSPTEADLALHAMIIYMNLKSNEVSDNTRRMAQKLSQYILKY